MSEVEQVESPKTLIKRKCAECIKGPKNIIKTLILIVCVGVVLQQISACVKKLIVIPITTYTHFDFNHTLMYPSVTFCREPPYKYSKMVEYGVMSHLNNDSTWRDFDYSNISLDKLWDEITFNEADMFVMSGLDKLRENLNITSTLGYTQGRCYTLTPNILSTEASTGYSVTLQHNEEDIENTDSTTPPGYHVYIHYTNEPFTEVTVYNGGLVDEIYVNVGETVKVKLKVDQYQMISTADDPCETKPNYSANACTTQYVWDLVAERAGCSGPWMQSDLPRCSNFSGMQTLITNYTKLSEGHQCATCHRTCNSYIYNGYVTDRQKQYTWDPATMEMLKTRDYIDDSDLQTQVYLYFNSMMVSVYEERYNYDGNMFLSDLGGSVGFLLGLSVIGLMEVFGKFWSIFVEPLLPKKKKEGSVTSSDTVDIQTRQAYLDEWNLKIYNM